jgi:PAS domain S-box-containing protein
MTLARKMVFSFMLVILVAVIGFGYIIYECTKADISVDDLQGKIPRMQMNNDITYNALTESSNLRDYLLYGDEQYRVEFERIAQLNPKLEDDLINQATTETSRKLSADTKALDQKYTLIANTKLIPLLKEGNKVAALEVASNELAPIEDQLLAKIGEAKVYRITSVSNAMDTANKASKLAEIVAVFVAILVTILGIIIGLFASNRITAWVTRDITNRKRLEKQLKEQVKYAELLFKTVPSAVLSVDKNRKIIRWNKIAEEITGYTAAEVIGKECSTVLHRTGYCEMCGMVNGSPLMNEKCEIVTKEGQIRHAFKSVAVLRDEFGEISERMGCFDDITELVNMEAELRESRERYAAIVNNAPQIVVIHKKGIVEFVNDAGIEVLGYKEEATMNRHMKGLTTKELFGNVNSILIEQIRGEACLSSEIELIKKSGEIITVLLKGTGITYEGERAILAVMMDITESKRLNAKLRASEEKFRQLAETINEIFLISDMERIVYVNPAYERISGMSDQSLLDNYDSLVELIHPADRERMRYFILLGYQNMNETANEEFRIIRLDGEIRWLWLQSYPIRAEANNSPLKATCIVDITDRKKIEDKLREQEKQTQMELLLAARVQRDSLPHPFAGNKVRVSTIFKPHSTVSGDFFNYKWFEEQNKLCGYIVDVSGHGVATALQTATFKMMLDNVLLNGEQIEEDTFQIINRRIMQYLYEGSFAALLYFEFDFQAATLKLISAGITLFLFANSQECSLEPISGCYLGIIDNPEIQIQIRPLKAGDIYCLMSDGASDLIESRGLNKQGSIIEYKNWLEKLAESPDRNDDFTVVCIESLQETKEIQILDIRNVEDIERAQIMINEFLERNTPLHAPVLEIAINEAMNNGFEACGQVCIRTRRVGGKLIIRVKDFGPGFNTKEINIRPKKDMFEEQFNQILEAEGGRGILLMQLFCDRVIYNDKGNEVLLMKRISNIAG